MKIKFKISILILSLGLLVTYFFINREQDDETIKSLSQIPGIQTEKIVDTSEVGRSIIQNDKDLDRPIISQEEIKEMLEEQESMEKMEQFELHFPVGLREEIAEYNNKIKDLNPDRLRLKSLDQRINEQILAGQGAEDQLLEERAEIREKLTVEAKNLGEKAMELAARIRDEKQSIRDQYFNKLAELNRQDN